MTVAYKIEKMLVRNPIVEVRDQTIAFLDESGDFEVPLRRTKEARVCIDECRVRAMRWHCSGWAFESPSNEPVKRVLLAYGGRLVAIGSPRERIDVRRKFKLVYDFTGFQFSIDAPRSILANDVATILFVLDKGILKVQASVDCATVPRLSSANLATSDVECVEFVGTGIDESSGTRRRLKRTGSFVINIDRIGINKNILAIQGWCYNRNNQTSRPIVGALQGAKIVSKGWPCTILRPDVVSRFAIQSYHNYYGFEIQIPRTEVADLGKVEVFAFDDTTESDAVGVILCDFSKSLDLERHASPRVWRISPKSRKETGVRANARVLS